MTQAKHVLVPIDGSSPSWAALDHAVAQFEGERITVLHVVDPIDSAFVAGDTGYVDGETFERAKAHGESLCDRAVERLREDGTLDSVVLDTTVEIGEPARTIVDYVDEHAVDHVNVGSHGRKGVSRVLLGSVAETVARRANAPVTVVR